MLGVGWPELIVVAGVALLVIGPDRLPRVMRELGRYYGQLRRAADDLRRAFTIEADRQDAAVRYRELQERRRAAQEARKQAEELRRATDGAVAQVADVPAASPTVAPETDRATELRPTADGSVPNDIAPDAPHPRLPPTRPA